MKNKQIRNTVIAGIGILGALTLTAGCGKADTSSGGGSGDKVVLAEPSWVGAQANAAVVKKLLEDELDVKVEAKQMDEPVAFDALNSGKASAILEDWHGVPKKEKKYVDEKKTVVSGGDLGVVGHIGWFVPKYYADKNQYPATLDALVSEGYLRKLPEDPFTRNSTSWQSVPAEPDPNNPTAEPGIYDVKSGSDGTALDGTKYSDWN